jgi:hypothetical protein
MKKFLKTYNAILEQDEELPPEEVQPAPVEAPVEEPAPEPEVETLSPESEVLLVRLIKKALVTEIDANDVDSISDMNDINENNAKLSLQILINIMKKYSTDIDIET